MIDKDQLRNLIVRTLREIDLHSDAAVNLLMGTAAVESRLGTYIRQLNSGVAKGIFQMENATEADIWDNYIFYSKGWRQKVYDVSGVNQPNPFHLEGNLIYQIVMARLHYWRVPMPLPMFDDINGLAKYWKDHYNTYLGAGTVEKFVQFYNQYLQ